MKKVSNLFLLALSVLVLVSCNDDDNNTDMSRVKVALKTSQTALKSDATTTESFVLEKFNICIGEIEFDINDDMEDVLPEGTPTFSDVELEGPFLIDLLSADAITGIDLASVNVPNAIYEEIEFEFEQYDKEEPAEMTNNTIVASGTYEGTPFTIISEEKLEIELEYENGYTLDGADSRLFIDLNLGNLKTLVAAIDFSGAITEEDGSILITKDKNDNILEQFEDAIEDSFDIDEDDEEDDD
ncbi:hypothetical protein J1N10_03580 [Carboxylicivirga sp. A043]|uniref:hypothetical protein n=1 Tax=Carboxylicivirga litoralis TaxID=2816963 RepID=UPI0021CB8185|nr:hypothetical protein [Carboxylicivirga sp. A043]MCU4155040.1 hypothetical protein [Carboxylicivirga sp. A043]